MVLMAALLGACSSEYPELKYVPEGGVNQNVEEVSDVEITPTLSYSSLFFSASTRGGNAFDNKNFPQDFQQHYLGSQFYILSFRRNNTESGEMAVNSDYKLLMNSTDNTDRRDCLVSTFTTIPTNKGHRGAVAMPDDLAGALSFWNDDVRVKKPILWNAKYPEVGYDFFGYYIDDAYINSSSATDDQVEMDITFDGTQDIMVGRAPEVTRKMVGENYPAIVQTTTVDTILTYGKGGYTTYGAKHGLQPKIEMEHCLTRFLFNFTLMEHKSIWIREIRVKSQTNGTLVVAARDPKKMGFKPSGAESFVSMGRFNYLLTPNIKEMLGKGLMLPARGAYDVEIDFDETYYMDLDNTQPVTVTQTQKLTLKPEGAVFEAGTTYIVNMSMYGAQVVNISATLQKWAPGGVIDLPMGDY